MKIMKLLEAVTGKCLEVEENVTPMSEQRKGLNKKKTNFTGEDENTVSDIHKRYKKCKF